MFDPVCGRDDQESGEPATAGAAEGTAAWGCAEGDEGDGPGEGYADEGEIAWVWCGEVSAVMDTCNLPTVPRYGKKHEASLYGQQKVSYKSLFDVQLSRRMRYRFTLQHGQGKLDPRHRCRPDQVMLRPTKGTRFVRSARSISVGDRSRSRFESTYLRPHRHPGRRRVMKRLWARTARRRLVGLPTVLVLVMRWLA